MKPILGISGDLKRDPPPAYVRLKLSYVEAIERAGGLPVILPPVRPEDVPALLERLDGVVLSGGGDVDTRSFGIALHPKVELMDARRQTFDLALAKAVLDASLPALGICLGMQELAVAAGGTMHQHLPDAGYRGLVDHGLDGADALHEVEIVAGSRLASIVRTTRARVASHHHQAVAELPSKFTRTAIAPDGVLEAFEAPGERFLVAVQWHPERTPESKETQALFRALVEAARARS